MPPNTLQNLLRSFNLWKLHSIDGILKMGTLSIITAGTENESLRKTFLKLKGDMSTATARNDDERWR